MTTGVHRFCNNEGCNHRLKCNQVRFCSVRCATMYARSEPGRAEQRYSAKAWRDAKAKRVDVE